MSENKQLSPRQIARLARVIAVDDMESIAEGYLEIEPKTIKNLHHENQGKADAFNRSVLRYWKEQESWTRSNTVQIVVFFYLYLEMSA